MSAVRAARILPLLGLLAVAALSGCFGIPEGAADTGDRVAIRYSAYDLDSGERLRDNATATFDLGSGGSGLGLQLERAVRGHTAGDSFEVTSRDDGSLGFNEPVRLDRALPEITAVQSASLSDFQRYVGPAAVNVTFPAYGIYTGRVTAVTNTTITFRVEAEDGQLDPVPEVGAMMETHVGDGVLTRRLNPVVDSTFTIAPPASPFEQPLLGLQPGIYKVLGATEDELLLARSTVTDDTLLDRDLRYEVTLMAITPGAAEPVPTDNYGARGGSPQLNGDPYSALGTAPPSEEPADDHGH